MSVFGEYRKHIAKISVKYDENRGHQGQGHQHFFCSNIDNCGVFNKAMNLKTEYRLALG